MDLKKEVVEFRDGSKVTVAEATWSVSIRLQELEEQASKAPREDPSEQIFHLLVYPKLLACSSGDVPDLETALMMPSSEIDRWYFAVKRINPDWFVALEQAAKLAESKELESETISKKGKKPIGSTPSS